MRRTILVHLILDEAFQLEAEDNRATEGIGDNPLPPVLVVEGIEVIGGVAGHIDVNRLEAQRIAHGWLVAPGCWLFQRCLVIEYSAGGLRLTNPNWP